MSRPRNRWTMAASILLALLLGLVPLPELVQPLRPFWLALVMAYWVVELPDSVSLSKVFAIGLISDLLVGGLLGEHALRLTIMAFILQRFRARMRFFPLPQQAVALGVLLLNDRVIDLSIHAMLGLPILPWAYWWAPAVGMLLWPPLFLLIDGLHLGNRR